MRLVATCYAMLENTPLANAKTLVSLDERLVAIIPGSPLRGDPE